MTLKRTFLVIVTTALVFGMAATGFSFNQDSLNEMLYDAAQFCPPSLQAYLQQNERIVHWGVGFAGRWKRYRMDPWEMETVYRALVSDLKSGKADAYQTAKRFGVLASYAAETILPGSIFGNSLHYTPTKVVYPGYSQMPELKSRISYLVRQYRQKYWWNSDPEVLRRLYQKAVTEIVDLWVSAWNEAGLDISGVAEDGATITKR